MKTDDVLPYGTATLAPMAGFTDAAFRAICRDFGCRFTVTEMVSSAALMYGNKNTLPLLYSTAEDKPCAVQIFGHDPQMMADSVLLPQLSSFAVVDINMGCPVKKIVGGGDGSALLEDPALAARIVSAVKKASGRIVSVKFRVGVNSGEGAASFAAKMAEAGADFLTVHLRTRKQMYAGNADYSLLPDIVKAARIPVVANGDVTDRESYLRAMDGGAYAVAVGRGALGRPYVFAELAGQEASFDLLQTVEKHARLIASYKIPRVAANEMKKHIAFYLKGKRGAKQAVVAVQTAQSLEEQMRIVRRFLTEEKE